MRYGLGTVGVALMAALVLAASGVAQGPADEADLAVTKSDSPDPVRAGEFLTYTIKVRNLGPAAAVDTTITDRLPGTVQLVSASGATCDLKGSNVKCELGMLASGERRTVTLEVFPGEKGAITNTVTATSKTADANKANNEANETTQVRPSGSQPGPGKSNRCLDHKPTMVGTPGADTILGTPERDVVLAKGGDDEIRGRGTRDLICAGGGEDVVRAGGGDDRVKGGAGSDRIRGQAGADVLRGNRGGDRLRGNRGEDTLIAGSGKDRCWGGPGNDSRRSC